MSWNWMKKKPKMQMTNSKKKESSMMESIRNLELKKGQKGDETDEEENLTIDDWCECCYGEGQTLSELLSQGIVPF